MADPIVHFEVGITDGARARDFYGELFGWRFQTEPDESNTLVVFEEGIGGNLMQVPEGASPYVTFYVLVDDTDAYLERVERLGGKTMVPSTAIPGVGEFAMLADPDGNLIALFTPETSAS
ncbi:MAG TPA: VOC family protein [Actinomycetota bacterium]|nr:VOC family protein [Actinomycetota bacterium]